MRVGIYGGIGLLHAIPSSAAGAGPMVMGLRIRSSPSSTRVVVDLSAEVSFQVFSLSSPPRVVVDIEDVSESKVPELTRINSPFIDRVRLDRDSPGALRLLLDLKDVGLQHDAFLLPPMQGYHFRLVIDVKSPEVARRMKEARYKVQKEKTGRAYVVVIDPGHGGEDPGAIGPRKTKEKDVVLTIARMLKKRLNREANVRAFLTRTEDYYVELGKRVEIAQEYGADLFLSIHTDAARNRRLNGASVYSLSLKGATDVAARILAERENASDFMRVLRQGEDPDVTAILLDLMQTQTISESVGLGRIVLDELGAVHRLRFSTTRQAGFRVLKAPDVPSILVEVAYISNREEEELLRTPTFLKGVARSLEISAYRFLCEQEQVRLYRLNPGFCNEIKPRVHIVQLGQTLLQIASRYETTVREIQKANKIKDISRIYPGQRLFVP
jgi:N-acetylmuramoyl-L-alanine amidase